MTPDQKWEHTYVTGGTHGVVKLTQTINDLATHGWELVSTHSADKTIGLVAITAFLRRPIQSPPPPDDTDPGWKRDPTGRSLHRHWDGTAWTWACSDGGDDQHRDPPTLLNPTPGLTQ